MGAAESALATAAILWSMENPEKRGLSIEA